MESILQSIKKMLGIPVDYTHFDQDLVLLINSEFDALRQLGVGPSEPFQITRAGDEVWSDFLTNQTKVNMAKEFIFLRVRLSFDPPNNSFLVENMKNKIDELVWRMNVDVETEWTPNL